MGITAAITTALTSIGVPGVIADVAAPALIGAGGGAALSGITGGDPGMGALTGGLTGGAIGGFGGVGGPIDSLTGIGGTASDVLAGAGAGALGSGITGGNPLTGTLTGAGSGLISGLDAGNSTAGGSPSGSVPATPTGMGTPSAGGAIGAAGGGAAATAAPAALSSGVGPSGLTGDVSAALTSGGGAGSLTGGIGLDPTAAGTTALPALTQPNGSPWGSDLSGGSAAPVAGTGTAGAAAGTAQNSISKLVSDPSLKNLGGALGSNANWLVPALGLGYVASQSQQQPAGYGQILNQANQLGAQGQQLQGYLQSGNLPPGLQGSVSQATQAAKAAIRSQYASRGMSNSSAEAQDLAAADIVGQNQGAQLAMQLLQQGVSDSQLSSQLYTTIMNQSLSQDKELSSALGNFAAAAAGGAARAG